jgi:hypothetical protein
MGGLRVFRPKIVRYTNGKLKVCICLMAAAWQNLLFVVANHFLGMGCQLWLEKSRRGFAQHSKLTFLFSEQSEH